MFKSRKDYLGIILFAMVIQDLFLKEAHKYEDFESNKWVILDPLGNIYDIYAKPPSEL